MFSIATLFAGFKLWQGEKFGKFLYHAIVTLLIIALLGGVWYKMFYQRTAVDQSTQTAEHITNITQEAPKDDIVFVGIKIGQAKLGLRL